MMERKTLTVDEVCKALGLGRNKVYKMLQSGEIPARQIGATWIISKDAFYLWLNGGE